MSDDEGTFALEVSVGMMGKMKEKQNLVFSKFDGKDNQIFWEDEMGNLRLKNAEFGIQGERRPTTSFSDKNKNEFLKFGDMFFRGA